MFEKTTLQGKSILITGGGSGLGFAMARKFSELGAAIAICGRNAEKLEKAATTIRQAGGKVATYAADISDYNQVDEMFKFVVHKLSGIDAIVNNAAVEYFSASEDLRPDEFKAVMNTVLYGTFNCSSCFGNYCIKSERPGHILNIVATYTETGSSFVLPSACAKAGVYALTNTLAYEWGVYGIRANAIAPGTIPTKGFWDKFIPDQDFEKKYVAQLPMQRFGTQEEFINLAAFLMSDMAPYINGECITMDGGERLQGGTFNFLTSLMSRPELKQLFRVMKMKNL